MTKNLWMELFEASCMPLCMYSLNKASAFIVDGGSYINGNLCYHVSECFQSDVDGSYGGTIFYIGCVLEPVTIDVFYKRITFLIMSVLSLDRERLAKEWNIFAC